MNPMQIFQQLMSAPNKGQMIQSLINQNPQLNQMWQMSQQMAQNPNKEQVLQQLAQQKGVSVDVLKQEAQKFGINV